MRGYSSKLQITCSVCGVKFFPKNRQRSLSGNKFCSSACFHASKCEPIEQRFHKYLSPPNEHGCILWTGPLNAAGYGMLGEGRNQNGNPIWFRSNRLAWKITCGDFPPDGVEVMHLCDKFYAVGDVTYRRCVNVAHLLLGTHEDNMKHMCAVGRNDGIRGENSVFARLTEESVRQIRLLYATGQYSMMDLAVEFKTSQPNVNSIVHRWSWKHVE